MGVNDLGAGGSSRPALHRDQAAHDVSFEPSHGEWISFPGIRRGECCAGSPRYRVDSVVLPFKNSGHV